MDWSLVLASQGIEHIIDHDEETGWALSVAVANHAAALDHIRQYRLENRHWHWRHPVLEPGLVFDGTSLAWVLLVVGFYVWSQVHAGARAAGLMTHAALAHGEWWRLFTAAWLHANPPHLALNAVFGFLFLGLAMGRYGAGVGLLAAYLAGAGGNVADGWIRDTAFRGLGASGVVMGALGLLAFPALNLPRRAHGLAFKFILAALLAGVLLFVMVGTDPEADVVAHLGGFVCGWLLGLGLTRLSRLTRRTSFNLAAGIIFAALVILPWWLALRHGK